MTINLEGLTKQQYQIAELLWQCDTQADVQQLKSCLPRQLQQDADTVHTLMIAAVFDQYEDITEDVQDLIQSLK